MLVLNKQVMLSVDTPLDRPEIRRVSFFTENNNIYLELAIDRTEFIKLHDFDSSEIIDPDALLDMEQADLSKAAPAVAAPVVDDESDELLRSLGM
jgi:hypothetical protein